MAKPEILNVTPEEAVALFRSKGYHVGFDWRDTDAAQHRRSFTVAKAMRLDILEDIRREVDRAIAEGTTLDEFRDNLEPTLRRKGWWGRKQMLDPVTGQERVVQLGSPRRLEVIFDTNVRMSYAHGRWQRIERVAEARPWLRYVAVQDARTRPDHLAWHGTILRFDDPWWATHFPPNGWRCRCTVEQLSSEDLEEFGFAPSDGPPAGSGLTRPWTNRRTGAVEQVPAGIDPGFQFNVGTVNEVQEAERRLAEKLAGVPAALRGAAEAAIAREAADEGLG